MGTLLKQLYYWNDITFQTGDLESSSCESPGTNTWYLTPSTMCVWYNQAQLIQRGGKHIITSSGDCCRSGVFIIFLLHWESFLILCETFCLICSDINKIFMFNCYFYPLVLHEYDLWLQSAQLNVNDAFWNTFAEYLQF